MDIGAATYQEKTRFFVNQIRIILKIGSQEGKMLLVQVKLSTEKKGRNITFLSEADHINQTLSISHQTREFKVIPVKKIVGEKIRTFLDHIQTKGGVNPRAKFDQHRIL